MTQYIRYSVEHAKELGLIMGKRTRNIDAASWRDYVWGDTCVNDVTARDFQRKDGQWTRGKGFDTFCPVGRWAVPAAEVEFESLRVETYLDDRCVQSAPVTDMIFGPGAVLAHASQFLTHEPGDLKQSASGGDRRWRGRKHHRWRMNLGETQHEDFS
ncbi:MAG: hypothetical protein FJW32_12110 [Acidobacteria bacterium]|nr:hypothetical protein [Acidobacteriota bacterium]